MAVAQAIHPVRWTVDEYYKMGEVGLFDDRKVELLAGEINEMPPIGPDHWTGTTRLTALFVRLFSDQFLVSCQNPLRLNDDTEPEPDFVLVEGDLNDFTDHIPTTAALVVEVSFSTLGDDRTVKAGLYARAEIAEYWIVNLVDEQLEVHRAPQVKPDGAFGFGYNDVTIYQRGQSLAPLCAPQTMVAVADLLP